MIPKIQDFLHSKGGYSEFVDEKSILTAYPLDLIK